MCILSILSSTKPKLGLPMIIILILIFYVTFKTVTVRWLWVKETSQTLESVWVTLCMKTVYVYKRQCVYIPQNLLAWLHHHTFHFEVGHYKNKYPSKCKTKTSEQIPHCGHHGTATVPTMLITNGAWSQKDTP